MQPAVPAAPMRLAALALALVVLTPGALAADRIRQCVEFGCVVVEDTDGDEEYDWANAALAIEELLVVNGNLNRTLLLWELVVTSEELGGELGEEILHEAGEVVGEEFADAYHTVSLVGAANLTGPSGDLGFNEADMLLFVGIGDHETGQQETVVWQYVRVSDTDEDELPDRVETLP